MTTIASRQNQPRCLELLAAQRNRYSRAKSWWIALIVITIILPALASVTIAGDEVNRPYIALGVLVVILTDYLILSPHISNLRRGAALIQEEFDCYVLDIPWSSLTVGQRIPPEIVAMESGKYRIKHKEFSDLQDWYSPSVDKVNECAGKLICQRTNASWDADLRFRFSIALLALIIVLGAVLLAVGFWRDFSLADFVLTAFMPMLPSVLFLIREWKSHRESIVDVERLRTGIEELLRLVCSRSLATDVIEAQTREIQNKIFDLRSSSSFVPDFLYRLGRDARNLEMNASAEHWVNNCETWALSR